MKRLNEYRIRYVCDGNLLEELTINTDGYDIKHVEDKFFNVFDGTYYDILDILKVNKDD